MKKINIPYVMAITLATIGAGVSLYGLVLMFGIYFLPIGIGLECGKLTAAAALHQCWNVIGWRIRYALTGIVVTLMVLTSSGIYGFVLTRYMAHIAAITAPALEKAAAADEDITKQANKVSDITKQISDLDAAPATNLQITAKPKSAAAIAAQANAQKEAMKLRVAEEQRKQTKRDSLTAKRDIEATELARLRGIRAEVASEVKASEAEVGPVKLVADVFGVDPGKVVGTTIAAIYDALCVLLLLVAGTKTIEVGKMHFANVATKKKNSRRSQSAKRGWQTRRRRKTLKVAGLGKHIAVVAK